MKYDEVLPIDAHISTAWMVEFTNGCKQLNLWHKDAKIEDVVEAMKVQWPNYGFTVAAVDVGVFTINHIDCSLSNGRKLNQDMEVVVE